MILIGNYNSWIKQEWVDYLTNNDGLHIPRDFPPYKLENSALPETGWDLKSVYSILYSTDNTDIVIDHLPWTNSSDIKFYWWVNKLIPSMVYPKIRDSTYLYDTCCRYWIPLQDYEQGHIFVYEDTLMTGYKRGDVYMYTDPTAYVYAANAGRNMLLHLNFTTNENK